MVQMQINLPDAAGEFIQRQVAEGRYRTADELVAELVEVERVRAAKEKLAQLIREGLEGPGEDVEFTDPWWEQHMDELKAEAERRRSA